MFLLSFRSFGIQDFGFRGFGLGVELKVDVNGPSTQILGLWVSHAMVLMVRRFNAYSGT